MSNILIEASNITKIYDPDIFLKRGKNYYALDNVNFQLEEGDFTCITVSYTHLLPFRRRQQLLSP